MEAVPLISLIVAPEGSGRGEAHAERLRTRWRR
jgi:hypothetical protein